MQLRIQNIRKSYPTGPETAERVILDGLNLEISQGERLAIVGPSGSGKTTLLNLMATLDSPDSGAIFFDNQDLTNFNETELAQFRNQRIGIVFQLHHLLPQLTLWENVLLPTLAHKNLQSKAVLDRAKRLIERVGISAVMHQKPAELSGGECQRAAVVRALVNAPSLLLADEPTGALDRNNADNLIELLVALNKEEGVTLVVVTHAEGVANRMDRILLLENGALIEKSHR